MHILNYSSHSHRIQPPTWAQHHAVFLPAAVSANSLVKRIRLSKVMPSLIGMTSVIHPAMCISQLLWSTKERVKIYHCAKMPVTTMLTYPWKCTVLHCNHLGNTWKPLVLMTRHFDYCPSASEGDNQSVRSSAPVVSRCFPGGYNVKLYISRGRLAWWLLAFLCCDKRTIVVITCTSDDS